MRDARRGLVVAAVNLAGRRAGIRPAMRLSEATALVDTEIRLHEPDEDIEGLCHLAEQAQQFSPIVGLEQLDKKMWAGRTLHQPECLLLDVTGICNLFGGENSMLEQVSQWLRAQNYFGCLGLAGSIGAAWALANYQTRLVPPADTPEPTPHIPSCRYSRAELAGDAAAIASLTLAGLRLETETIGSLRRLGIRSIGQLDKLPRAGMATRLGDHLLLRWDQAAGRQREPIVTLHSSPDWQLEQTLEYPTLDRPTIEELVRRLSRQLAERLNRRGEGALRIVCRLDMVQSPPLVMQLGLYRPSCEAGHLEMLLTSQLEQQLRTARGSQLWRLSLQATLTAPLQWRQADLFELGETANRQQLARLVDTLSGRLGRKQVLSAQVRREAQPELGCTLQPLTGRRQDGSQQDTIRKLSSRLARNRAEPAYDDPQRRPTHLFSPPLEIQVAGSTAMGTAACPKSFLHSGAWLQVIDSVGPERLESGWWRGPSARRDYYCATTAQGSRWWLYRDLNTAKWYLHGAFD